MAVRFNYLRALGKIAARLAGESLAGPRAVRVTLHALEVLVAARRHVDVWDAKALDPELAKALGFWTSDELDERVDKEVEADRAQDIYEVAEIVFLWGKDGHGDRFALVQNLEAAGHKGIADEFRRKAIMIAGG